MFYDAVVRWTFVAVWLATGVSSCIEASSDGRDGEAEAVVNGRQQDEAREPLVVFMDSRHPARVYDEQTVLAGRTNADVLLELLSDLPVRRMSEVISPTWRRDEAIVAAEPDLVVIHYSGFREQDGTGPRDRLREFISYFGNSTTQIVIYSRTREAALNDTMQELLAPVYPEYASLQSRIHVFGLDDHGPRSWSSPPTAEALKERVRQVLGI